MYFRLAGSAPRRDPKLVVVMAAIFYPFSQFCEIVISLPSLQKQPKTAPNLFQRGVDYGKYGCIMIIINVIITIMNCYYW